MRFSWLLCTELPFCVWIGENDVFLAKLLMGWTSPVQRLSLAMEGHGQGCSGPLNCLAKEVLSSFPTPGTEENDLS